MKKYYFYFRLLCLSFIGTISYAQTYTIPVVVHNMHNGSQGQMTNQEIMDLISDLDDYYDQYTPRFNFELARMSPDGYCGIAINDVYTTEPYGSAFSAIEDFQLKSQIRWPSNQYLNIWTVVDIDNGASAGYAFTPCSVITSTDPPTFSCMNPTNQNSNESQRDGVVFKYDEPLEYLAHEVAHWLNVFHTNGPDEFASNSNWFGCHGPEHNHTQGDFCGDTPPVDLALIGSTNNTCNLDVPDLPDDNNNLMTRLTAAIDINSYLSPDQLQRMSDCMQNIRTNISSFSNLALTGISPFSVIDDNPVITQNTTWSLNNTIHTVDIMGDLTVEENVSFTVESGMTLRFCEGGKLIVKKGGKLNLRGTLTSIGDNKWDGVELYGDLSFSNAASFTGENNALIENATIGVRTYGPSQSQSGATVYTYNMTFDNCNISIDAAPIQNWSYILVTSTNFINNHNPDFQSFVRLNRWNGMATFMFSDFTSNSGSPCIEDHGIGIEAENSIFAVHWGCTFNKLGYGVKNNAATGQKPFFVWNSNFNGCYRGVYSNSVGNFTIWKNVFDNSGLSTGNISSCTGQDGEINNQVAIYLEGLMFGADIQENEFKNASLLTAVNIFADDLGPINNKIRNNLFNSPNGIVGDHQNSTTFPAGTFNLNFKRGLYFSCNDFQSSNKAVWSIDEFRLGIRQIQFHLNQQLELATAANKWLNGSNDDIINDYTLGTDIEYYHSIQPFDEPSEVIGVSLLPGDEYTCSTETTTIFGLNPTDPSDPSTGVQHDDVPSDLPIKITRQTEIENDITNLENNNNGSVSTPYAEEIGTGLWEQNDDVLADIIATYQLYPTVWNESSYINYLMKLNSIVGDYTAFNYYVGQNNWSSATNILNGIPTKYYMDSYQVADYNRLVNLYSIVNGTPLDQLNNSQVSNVITHAEGVKGTSKSWARSILTLHGYNYTSTFELPTSKTRKNKEQEVTRETHIYPNPVHDRLNIESNNTITSFVIESITGSEISRSSVQTINSLDVSSLQNGIYILKLKNGNEIIETHRFIKI